MQKKLLTAILWCVFSVVLYAQQTPIITKWVTNNTTATDTTITIPAYGSYTYAWANADNTQTGSGTVNNTGTTSLSTVITFPSAREYTVSIFPTTTNFKFYFNASSITSTSQKLTELSQLDYSGWNADLSNMFRGCTKLKITATDVPDFSNATNMSYMFYSCQAVPNMQNWNTSNVINMLYMFGDATNFNQPIKIYNDTQWSSFSPPACPNP